MANEARVSVIPNPDLATCPDLMADVAMTPELERIVWMPSPPLVPDDTPFEAALDRDHLSRMTFGERNLEREVLAMFAAQALGLSKRLAAQPDDSADLAHTLKGSARAVGAFEVADAAERVEELARCGENLLPALAILDRSVAKARAVIEIILNKS